MMSILLQSAFHGFALHQKVNHGMWQTLNFFPWRNVDGTQEKGMMWNASNSPAFKMHTGGSAKLSLDCLQGGCENAKSYFAWNEKEGTSKWTFGLSHCLAQWPISYHNWLVIDNWAHSFHRRRFCVNFTGQLANQLMISTNQLSHRNCLVTVLVTIKFNMCSCLGNCANGFEWAPIQMGIFVMICLPQTCQRYAPSRAHIVSLSLWVPTHYISQIKKRKGTTKTSKFVGMDIPQMCSSTHAGGVINNPPS